MPIDIERVIRSAAAGLGFELVDVERVSNGLLRVYIDHSEGINVEDCAAVSNQLVRVFTVEGIEFDRLEVSSPGLDRPLKRIEDFNRYVGHAARVRLHEMIGNRKRFDGVIESVGENEVVFGISADHSLTGASAKRNGSRKMKAKQKISEEGSEIRLKVALENIERARLIPQL